MEKDLSQICVGKIVGVHGIKGALKVKSYTEDVRTILEFKTLADSAGNKISLKYQGIKEAVLIVSLPGLTDRTKAESFVGLDLFANRDELPDIEEDGAYYAADLIGMKVLVQGQDMGTVIALENYGASDLLTVSLCEEGNPKMQIPFQHDFVLNIDAEAGTLEVDPDFFQSLLALRT